LRGARAKRRVGRGRARAGDEDAFRELTDPHRGELQVHCYRIVGSVQDAEDLVQETLLAAWRGLEAFEGRSWVRAWLLPDRDEPLPERAAQQGCDSAVALTRCR
jgi:hypothetical protein